MGEMRERIAKAIAGVGHQPENALYEDTVIVSASEAADAVLNALREPTPEMMDAGTGIIMGNPINAHDKPLPTLGNAYRAMIDSALSKAEVE